MSWLSDLTGVEINVGKRVREHYYSRKELALRRQLGCVHLVTPVRPGHTWFGDPQGSAIGIILQKSFEDANRNISKLSKDIRDIDGMSGQKYRSLINNLVSLLPDARYLEIGSWAGSTAAAAAYGNRVEALCIDNWSQFGGPKDAFLSNTALATTSDATIRLLESDFRNVDYSAIGKFNIYLFDGPHSERDQYDGVAIAQPALTDTYVLIVDDWNWGQVRQGTLRALIDIGATIQCHVEVRSDDKNGRLAKQHKDSDWHIGYFIGVIRKRS
jgi:Methyltransferase domain